MTNGRPDKMRAAAMGGLALGAASAVPVLNLLNCACCSLVILGGFLAAHLYLRNAPPAPEPPWGDVAIVGLLAGLIGAAVTAVLSLPLAFLGTSLGFWSTLQEAASEASLPEPFRNLLAAAGASTLAFGMILFSFVMNLFVYSVFSTMGALLGAAVLARRSPAVSPLPPPAPPPAI